MKYFAWLSAPIFCLLLFVACLPSIADDQQWADPQADWDDTFVSDVTHVNPSLLYWFQVDVTTLSATELQQGADQIEATMWTIEGYISTLNYLGQTEDVQYWQEISSILATWASVLRSLATIAPETDGGTPPANDDGSESGPGSEGTSGSGSGYNP